MDISGTTQVLATPDLEGPPFVLINIVLLVASSAASFLDFVSRHSGVVAAAAVVLTAALLYRTLRVRPSRRDITGCGPAGTPSACTPSAPSACTPPSDDLAALGFVGFADDADQEDRTPMIRSRR